MSDTNFRVNCCWRVVRSVGAVLKWLFTNGNHAYLIFGRYNRTYNVILIGTDISSPRCCKFRCKWLKPDASRNFAPDDSHLNHHTGLFIGGTKEGDIPMHDRDVLTLGRWSVHYHTLCELYVKWWLYINFIAIRSVLLCALEYYFRCSCWRIGAQIFLQFAHWLWIHYGQRVYESTILGKRVTFFPLL